MYLGTNKGKLFFVGRGGSAHPTTLIFRARPIVSIPGVHVTSTTRATTIVWNVVGPRLHVHPIQQWVGHGGAYVNNDINLLPGCAGAPAAPQAVTE